MSLSAESSNGPLPSAADDNPVDPLVRKLNEGRGRSTDERIVAPLRKPMRDQLEARRSRLAALVEVPRTRAGL